MIYPDFIEKAEKNLMAAVLTIYITHQLLDTGDAFLVNLHSVVDVCDNIPGVVPVEGNLLYSKDGKKRPHFWIKINGVVFDPLFEALNQMSPLMATKETLKEGDLESIKKHLGDNYE